MSGTSRYRWAVLAAGVFAQAGFVALPLGLPSIAVPMRDELSLSSTALGLILAAPTIGMIMTSYLWGRLSDRVGEGRVVMLGLFGAGGALFAGSVVHSIPILIALLLLAGALGSSANAASGKAVMTWFPGRSRGLAMGIRQSAQPLAGAAGAALLPVLVLGYGVPTGLAALAVICMLAGALAGPILRRPHPAGMALTEAEPATAEPATAEPATAEPLQQGEGDSRPLRDRRTREGAPVFRPVPRAISLRAICVVSGLLVIPQFTLASFAPLYLHDSRGMSVPSAAAVIAVAQALSAVARIMVGIWSDRTGDRTVPLLACAVGLGALLAATVVASRGALPGQVTLIAVTTVVAMTWNPLAFVIAGESALPERQGAALGVQNTIVLGFGSLTRAAIAPLMDGVGWVPLVAVEFVLPVAAILVILSSPARRPVIGRTTQPPNPRGRRSLTVAEAITGRGSGDGSGSDGS